MTHYSYQMRSAKPAFSIPSVLAIIAAITSFFFGAGLGFLLAIVAIVLGAIGMVIALSPNVRGGVISVVSVIAGLLGIVVALIKLIV